MNCLQMILAGASILALSACSNLQKAEDVTIGAFLESQDVNNTERRTYRSMGVTGATQAYMACMSDFNRTTVEKGFTEAVPIFRECQAIHEEFAPELLPVTLAKEIKEAYDQLSDEQIKAFGLPPRPE